MTATMFDRSYRICGITAAIVLALVLLGTDMGRNTLAWLKRQSIVAVTKATHITRSPLDRLDPTCPRCM